MHVDPQIVAQLRAMFLDGATPSRLIRHIATRLEGDPTWPTYVEPYFTEAFSVTTFVMDDIPQADLDRTDLSELNVDILRDMVGRKTDWRQAIREVSGPVWCDDRLVGRPEDKR
jgi:hypothetical protein